MCGIESLAFCSCITFIQVHLFVFVYCVVVLNMRGSVCFHRDRSKALHQRFSSLRVSGNLWHDLFVMREGVQIETTSMARRKLLMNYEWSVYSYKTLP